MKNSFLPKFKKQKLIKGFTLVETLVALLIFVLAMGAVTSFIILSYQANKYILKESVIVDEARRGIETMVREIRAAQTGDNGAYPIELADDKQFIFYSDIDNDGKVERVRYFLATATSTGFGSRTIECTAVNTGGFCNVTFSNFLTGTLKSASATVSVEGDLDNSNEYVEISAGGTTLTSYLCQNSCSHCAGFYQGTTTFDITSIIDDNTSITFTADGNWRVDRQCPSAGPYDHSMRARFTLNWTEQISATGTEFQKGVIEPVGYPVQYPLNQEKISVLTSYVRNDPPIFEYFDNNGDEITSVPARLVDTKLMKVYLVVNVDPNRPPNEFELESSVQLRNVKTE